MNVLEIARIIADCLLFLELTDDEKLDPDAALQMMEVLAANLKSMDKTFLRQLVDAFQVIAPEYPGKSQGLVRNMAYDFYLEEAIAADDPAQLAELQALRDARGTESELLKKMDDGQYQGRACSAMIAVQFARFLANFIVFLELTDEEALDLDEAVEIEEFMGSRLEELDKAFLRELVDAFQLIAPEYDRAAQQLVRDIAYGHYLEEAIAADDPARLAELQALRDARED